MMRLRRVIEKEDKMWYTVTVQTADIPQRVPSRCVNRGKTMFTSKLDTCFCPCLPAA